MKKPTDSLADVAMRLPYGSCPLPDIAAAGQLQASELQGLADAGFRAIVDIRPQGEPRGYDEPAAVRAAGLAYENIPVTLETLGASQFDRFRAFLADPANRPAVVHCASANRVGALLIPYLVLDHGRPVAEAVALARQAGLRSDALRDIAIAYINAQQQPRNEV